MHHPKRAVDEKVEREDQSRISERRNTKGGKGQTGFTKSTTRRSTDKASVCLYLLQDSHEDTRKVRAGGQLFHFGCRFLAQRGRVRQEKVKGGNRGTTASVTRRQCTRRGVMEWLTHLSEGPNRLVEASDAQHSDSGQRRESSREARDGPHEEPRSVLRLPRHSGPGCQVVFPFSDSRGFLLTAPLVRAALESRTTPPGCLTRHGDEEVGHPTPRSSFTKTRAFPLLPLLPSLDLRKVGSPLRGTGGRVRCTEKRPHT